MIYLLTVFICHLILTKVSAAQYCTVPECATCLQQECGLQCEFASQYSVICDSCTTQCAQFVQSQHANQVSVHQLTGWEFDRESCNYYQDYLLDECNFDLTQEGKVHGTRYTCGDGGQEIIIDNFNDELCNGQPFDTEIVPCLAGECHCFGEWVPECDSGVLEITTYYNGQLRQQRLQNILDVDDYSSYYVSPTTPSATYNYYYSSSTTNPTTTKPANQLCNTEKWNKVKGTWPLLGWQSKPCAVWNSNGDFGDVLWFGSSNGLEPSTDYEFESFKLDIKFKFNSDKFNSVGVLFRTTKIDPSWGGITGAEFGLSQADNFNPSSGSVYLLTRPQLSFDLRESYPNLDNSEYHTLTVIAVNGNFRFFVDLTEVFVGKDIHVPSEAIGTIGVTSNGINFFDEINFTAL